jgi:hypothetical protein
LWNKKQHGAMDVYGHLRITLATPAGHHVAVIKLDEHNDRWQQQKHKRWRLQNSAATREDDELA